MSKPIFALTIITLLFIQTSFATDRIVQESGAGGAYTTISAALTASVSGDRILVFPKGGGNSYVENLSITKTNIKILSAVYGERFKVDGAIIFQSTATGGSIVNAVTSSSIYCNAANITVAECWARDYINSTSGDAMYLSNDTMSRCFIVKGRISGCVMLGGQGTTLSCSNPNTASNDTLMIIGNTIHGVSHGIEVYSANQYVVIANNYIEMNNPNPVASFGIRVHTSKASATVRNLCVNNTVTQYFGESMTNAMQFLGYNYDIENNVIKTFGTIAINLSYSLGYTVGYNYSNVSNLNVQNQTTNVENASTCPFQTNGVLIFNSPAINGGNPGNKYLDTDLTRNDAGCFGGSFNIANFRTAAPDARVLFVNAPREVMVNTPFRINADGLAK